MRVRLEIRESGNHPAVCMGIADFHSLFSREVRLGGPNLRPASQLRSAQSVHEFFHTIEIFVFFNVFGIRFTSIFDQLLIINDACINGL